MTTQTQALELARSALKELVAQNEGRFLAIKHDHFAMQDARSAIRRLDEALANQQEQYPFGVYDAEDLNRAWKSGYDNCKAQKRTWVGLTDIEYSILAEQYTGADGLDCVDYGRAIEAKLKEKNNG